MPVIGWSTASQPTGFACFPESLHAGPDRVRHRIETSWLQPQAHRYRPLSLPPPDRLPVPIPQLARNTRFRESQPIKGSSHSVRPVSNWRTLPALRSPYTRAIQSSWPASSGRIGGAGERSPSATAQEIAVIIEEYHRAVYSFRAGLGAQSRSPNRRLSHN